MIVVIIIVVGIAVGGWRSGTSSSINKCQTSQDCTQMTSSPSTDGNEGDDNDRVRQISLSEGFGVHGQRKLLSSYVSDERKHYNTRIRVLAISNSNPYYII